MIGAFIVGALTVGQSQINGELGQLMGDGVFAAWISFSVGLGCVLVVAIVLPSQRLALKRLRAALRPDPSNARALRPWMLLGGLGGATFVAAQGMTVQYLGVAIFTVAVVAAQNANSLVVDRVGLGPSGVQPITTQRIIAALVATVGVGIAVSSQLSGADFAVGPLILALVAGVLVAVQQAINGRVSGAAGSPWTAGLTNFTFGWLGLSLALLISHVVNPHGWAIPPVPWHSPVLWLGGFIGVAFIVVAAAVIHVLGVLLFALLSIAGQVSGALVVDFAFPQTGHPFSWTLVVGVLVTGVAVALAAVGRAQVAGQR